MPWAALAALVLLTGGCGAGRLHTQPIERVRIGRMDEPFPDATQGRWQADPNRLRQDLRRAFDRMHWAVVRVRPSPPPTRPAQSVVHYGEALLPDGRTATVIAGGADDGVAVAVRIGHFGDAALERRFLATLRKVMRGKPAPQRGGGFTLPPWPRRERTSHTQPSR